HEGLPVGETPARRAQPADTTTIAVLPAHGRNAAGGERLQDGPGVIRLPRTDYEDRPRDQQVIEFERKGDVIDCLPLHAGPPFHFVWAEINRTQVPASEELLSLRRPQQLGHVYGG